MSRWTMSWQTGVRFSELTPTYKKTDACANMYCNVKKIIKYSKSSLLVLSTCWIYLKLHIKTLSSSGWSLVDHWFIPLSSGHLKHTTARHYFTSLKYEAYSALSPEHQNLLINKTGGWSLIYLRELNHCAAVGASVRSVCEAVKELNSFQSELLRRVSHSCGHPPSPGN